MLKAGGTSRVVLYDITWAVSFWKVRVEARLFTYYLNLGRYLRFL